MIGGTDVDMWVRDSLRAIDLIFHTVRRRWPRFVFQNADDESAPYASIAEGTIPRPSGSEFFIYRDDQAALSWDKLGADPENQNTMLHVIMGEEQKSGLELNSMTLVCDTLSGEIAELIEEISMGIEELNRIAMK